jgi:RimJ/RimL family protein N-acetyltransferase/nitrite reductase/ring-hydroxylating ferredoxin subunit
MPDPINPPEPWLSDGVVALRAFRADDAAAITAACQDREIQRWVPLLPIPYTEADARGFILMSLQAWHDGTGCEFAIVDALDGRFLGAAGLHLGANARRHAIGYWVAPEARRRGIATRAVRLLSRWAFERLGTQRLGLWALPGNVASQAVAEKTGFRFEGMVRNWELDRDDNLIDAVMFAMTRDDLADLADLRAAAPDSGSAAIHVATAGQSAAAGHDAAAPGAGGMAASIAAVPRELRASGTRAAPFIEIAPVSELTPGSMRRVTLAGLDLLVAWTLDGILVTDDRCPHMAAPLSIGVLDGCVVSCPLHEGRFDLSSGETVQMPTTGGLDADGNYRSPWSPSGAEPKPEPPSRKLEARRLTRVNRLRYYPARIRDGRLEAQIPILPE